MRWFSLLLLLAALPGCPKAPCDSSTCGSGCCDSSGVCQTGDSASACGTAGALCSACLSGSCSALRICLGGTGGGSGGGGAVGGGMGGGGGGGSGGGGGGSTGLRTVTLTRDITFTDEQGTRTASKLSDAGVTVFLADGGSVQATRTATAYEAQNVPVGEYILRYGTVWYVARADRLDLGYADLGRPDLQYVDAGDATLTLGVSGLPAWNELDSMILFSQGANFYGWNTGALVSGPMGGEVPSSFTWNYGDLDGAGRFPRLEAARGDTLWALFLKYQPLLTTPVAGAAEDGGTADVTFDCNVLEGTAHVTSLSINAGANTATAAFTSTPTQAVGVTYPRTQWAGRAAEVHPQATPITEDLYLVAEPVAGSASADLLSCFNFPTLGGNPISDVNRSVTVVDPFPSGWVRSSFAQTGYRVTMPVLDAGTWSATGSQFARAGFGQPIVPEVHSPAQVRVQSIPADQLVTVAAAAPLSVTWQPGAAPAPTEFLVTVLALTKPAGSTMRTTVAAALTRGTSFSFPPGTLTVGGIYQLRVKAMITAAPESAPYSSEVTSSAEAITNPFQAQ